MERKKIDALLAELKLGSGDLAEKTTRLRLGRLLGADYFIFGSYLPVGEQLLVSGHIVHTSDGMMVKAADVDGDPARLEALIAELAQKLMHGLKHVQNGPP